MNHLTTMKLASRVDRLAGLRQRFLPSYRSRGAYAAD
jgi:hypothetical protein